MDKIPKPEKIYFEKIEKIWGPVLSFISALLALPMAIKEIIDGNNKSISIIFTCILAVIIFSLLLYVVLKKNKKTDESEIEKTWRYKKRYRLTAIFTLVVLVVGSIVGGLTYYIQRQSKLIVAIADFDGPEEVYGVRNEILDSLRSQFDEDDKIIIQTVDLVITPDDGSDLARKIGEKMLADIVIWGWYRPAENTNMTINLEYLTDLESFSKTHRQKLKPFVTLDELETFSFQKKIGQETGAFLIFVSGYIDYVKGDYDKSIASINDYLKMTQETDIFKNKINGIELLSIAALNNDDFDLVIQHTNDYLGQYPDNEVLLNNRGVAYATNGMRDKAQMDFSKALEISKNPLIYENRANVYLEQSNYEKAIEDFKKAIEANPGYANAYSGLSYAYYLNQNFDFALEEIEKAINLDSKNSLNYYTRGLIFFAQNRCIKSIWDITKAIRLEDENSTQESDYFSSRGNAYDCVKAYTLASKDYSRAIKLDPENPDPYFYLGINYFEQKGDLRIAIENFNKSIELKPNDPGGYIYRARANFELGNYEQSLKDVNIGIELDPKIPIGYMDRGIMYLVLEEFELAIKDFSLLIETGQEIPSKIYYYRAIAYEETGDRFNAALDLARYEELIKAEP